jgi:hypothetical protein
VVSGEIERHAASFRDPAGFIFEHNGVLARAVHPNAVADVELLFSSGLHDELVAAGLLVRHRRIEADASPLPEGWLLLEPERLPVISYASEWTDAQLGGAAALTLELQQRALTHGMSLKDASSFNVQFAGARPVFIDLLSFTRLEAGRAWIAYRQFCEHFLAPLALRKFHPDALASSISLTGISLPIASRLLPLSSWFSSAVTLHVHLHARAAGQVDGKRRAMQAAASSQAIVEFRHRLTTSLGAAVRALTPKTRASSWSDYRNTNVYSVDSAARKLAFVRQVAQDSTVRRALDLGANDGHYARALVDMGIACTAVEVDAACSEAIYESSVAPPYDKLLNTLRVDLTNPTPAHGWAHKERAAFAVRMQCDLTLSLALVHHLSITYQVPFAEIAAFLAALAPHAVVEYVPVHDVMSRQLLGARTEITTNYLETLSRNAFEAAFARRFECRSCSESLEGGRFLYHFERRLPLA